LFDEGNDTPNPPPAQCAQEQLAGGFVHLDNIEVATSNPTYGTKVLDERERQQQQQHRPVRGSAGGGRAGTSHAQRALGGCRSMRATPLS
jgi:hypothetical protein